MWLIGLECAPSNFYSDDGESVMNFMLTYSGDMKVEEVKRKGYLSYGG
jgi:hypothetical protein